VGQRARPEKLRSEYNSSPKQRRNKHKFPAKQCYQENYDVTLYVEMASPQLWGSGRWCGLELIFPEANASMVSE